MIPSCKARSACFRLTCRRGGPRKGMPASTKKTSTLTSPYHPASPRVANPAVIVSQPSRSTRKTFRTKRHLSFKPANKMARNCRQVKNRSSRALARHSKSSKYKSTISFPSQQGHQPKRAATLNNAGTVVAERSHRSLLTAKMTLVTRLTLRTRGEERETSKRIS